MKRILVVDDQEVSTEIIKMDLELLGGYEVFTENHAPRAVATARQCRPDVILLDVMMPEMLGSEVAARLQEDPELRHIKIVFVTGIVKKSETKLGDAAADRHRMLAKPVKVDDLVAAIDAVLAEPD